MRILLTSGGTKVPIDRVRHIGNMSHGTFGSRIALQLLRRSRIEANEADKASLRSMTFFHARYSKTPFVVPVDVSFPLEEQLLRLKALRQERMALCLNVDYTEKEFGDFHEYAAGLRELAPTHDVIVLAAAVSDYLVANYVDGKIRSKDALHINLEPAPKLIGEIKSLNPSCKLVGFKLLVDSNDEELVAAARESAVKNDCAFVVANDLRDIKQGQHRVMLVGKDGLISRHAPTDGNPYGLADVVAKAVMELGKP